ncbi:MAG: ATP-grasp domain-containing protein [Spirochaetales bacterium]|uniref:ATP-grasp domain-containing protein n=1 Tax=Candidatus Thalassospirochaeta sargassi TaxID=3119039 RepID=A0AAJ1IE78_9SPIO|nr:ATP-grasp domain-containing protein [Spirochaetales bacterium]
MENKRVAIVLGGTNPHITLIENLQDRGFYTVLVDYYENPPAKKVADEHVQDSTLDMDIVLKIAREYKAELVISTCIDQANVTACYVAEKLGLPAPYSFQTSLNVSDKVLMKQIMWDNNLPTSKFICIDDEIELNNTDLVFPVVVKPADATGSKGVKRADTQSELSKYIKYALELSRNNKVVVEEFYTGYEVSVDCFIQDSVAHVIMTRQKLNFIDHKGAAIQCYVSIAPAKLSEIAKNKIKKIAQGIADAFHLDTTSLLLQVMVDGDNVNIIEFAPRVGGGLSYQTVKRNTGFDILNATINSFLKVKTKLDFQPPKYFLTANNIYAEPCVYGSVSGHEELKQDNIIEDFYFYKTKGMNISSEMASRDRAGSFIVKAEDYSKLLDKTKTAIERLEVYDIYGERKMRRDIFLKEEL